MGEGGEGEEGEEKEQEGEGRPVIEGAKICLCSFLDLLRQLCSLGRCGFLRIKTWAQNREFCS